MMKGTEISVARIVIADHISGEVADEFEAVYQEICPKCFNKSMRKYWSIPALPMASELLSIRLKS